MREEGVVSAHGLRGAVHCGEQEGEAAGPIAPQQEAERS